MSDDASARRTAAFLAGQAVSFAGSRVTLVALPWAVLAATHSPVQTSVVLLSESVPFAVAGTLIGPLLDRISPRRVLVSSDVLRGAAIGLAAALIAADRVWLPVFVLIGFAMGCGRIASSATREASVPLLAGSDTLSIVRLNARIYTFRDATNVVGPALGGLMIATIGPAPALVFDCVTFGFSAACSGYAFHGLGPLTPERSTPDEPRRSPAEQSKDISYRMQISEGLRFLVRQQRVRLIVAQSALTNMVFTPLTALLLVVLAKNVWHSSQQLGLVLGAAGVGSVVGGIVMSLRPRALPGFRWYGLLVLGTTGPYWALAGSVFPVILAGAFLSGLFSAALNTAGDAALQIGVPAGLRGRIFGTVVSCLAVMEPIGLAIAGVAVAELGIRASVTTALILLTAISVAVIPLAARSASPAHDEPSHDDVDDVAVPT